MKKEWTEARLKAFIISGLRAASRRYPLKWEVLHDASVGKKINKKTNRLSNHYKCNACKGVFPSAEVQVDHQIPVIDPTVGFVDWNTYIDRLFCVKENLQCLCTGCHSEKTAQEKKLSLSTKPSKPPKAPSSLKGNSKRKNSTS